MLYSEELIEEIRSQNDIYDVISSYVPLKKKGNSYFGLCPFHNEKTPSFSVSREKQMYYCFSCHAGGNVITFIMEYENFTFVDAIKYLAERVGIALPETDMSQKAKEEQDYKQQLLQVNKLAAGYYYRALYAEGNEKALNYFVNRGITEETRKKFGLGYAPVSTGALYSYLKRQGFSDKLLKDSGIIKFDDKRGGYDLFWSRVMFPIADVHNRVIAFGGRVIGDGTPKYVNSSETLIFDKSRNLYGLNIARSSRSSYLLLCEGYMDVIALHQAGFNCAVASLGTALTQGHANLLKRYTDKVYLTFDSDGAGKRAAIKAIPILKEVGLSVKVINLLPYKDPDEFIKALGVEAFQKRIEEAQSSFMYEIDTLASEYKLSDPEEEHNFGLKVGIKLRRIESTAEREIYMKAVSRQYAIKLENLEEYIKKAAGVIVEETQAMEQKEQIDLNKKNKEDVINKSQKLILTWLVDDVKLFCKVKDILLPEDFRGDLFRALAIEVYEKLLQGNKVEPAKIVNQFNNVEEQRTVASIFNAELKENMTPEEYEKAVNDTVMRIKKNALDERRNSATDLIELQKIREEQNKMQKLHISL